MASCHDSCTCLPRLPAQISIVQEVGARRNRDLQQELCSNFTSAVYLSEVFINCQLLRFIQQACTNIICTYFKVEMEMDKRVFGTEWQRETQPLGDLLRGDHQPRAFDGIKKYLTAPKLTQCFHLICPHILSEQDYFRDNRTANSNQ